jgi:hypothetical protein
LTFTFYRLPLYQCRLARARLSNGLTGPRSASARPLRRRVRRLLRRRQEFARYGYWEPHRHEVFSRIEVVFSRFVDYSHIPVPHRPPVGQHLIDLPGAPNRPNLRRGYTAQISIVVSHLSCSSVQEPSDRQAFPPNVVGFAPADFRLSNRTAGQADCRQPVVKVAGRAVSGTGYETPEYRGGEIESAYEPSFGIA